MSAATISHTNPDVLSLPEAPDDFTGYQAKTRRAQTIELTRYVPEAFRGLPVTFFVRINGRPVASSDDWKQAVAAFVEFQRI